MGLQADSFRFCQFVYDPLYFLLFSFMMIIYLIYIWMARLWCDCKLCEAYLNSSWSNEFVNLCDWYTYLLQKSPTKTVHIHILNNTITADPDNVEHMLRTRFENYPKGKPFSTILGDFLGRGIFNVDGDLWRFQKKMASMALNKYSISSHAFEIVKYEIDHRLVPVLLSSAARRDGVLDLQDVFRRFSFDCICRFSFGLDLMCLDLSTTNMSDFAVSFDLASKLSAERAMSVSPLIWKMKRLLNLGSEKKLKEAIGMINNLAKGVIRQKRKMGRLSSQKDLLSHFMSTVDDDTYLRDIVVSFLLGGGDTVASALTSLFWLLLNHPHVESVIRNETHTVLGPHQELKNSEQLRQLHYLKAAVHESMRLYPPVQFDSKFCQEDDALPDGTSVKKGTRVTYHPYAMGRMREIWGLDCLEFKPERWLKDGIFFPENPFKYPVFQAGPRVCLGKEMALMKVETVAVVLLRRFQFKSLRSGLKARFSPGLTATLSGGLPVLVQERTGHSSS